MVHRSHRWIIGALVALLASTAWGASSSSLSSWSADDKKATKLTVLCTVEERWCAAQTAAFESQTGITTGYERLSGGDALAAVTDSQDKTDFSVWWGGSADGYVAAKAAGRLQPYTSPNAAKIPKTRKDADGYWTGIYIGALGFCSNRTKLAEAGVAVPNSWSDLLDPALKGRVSIAHPATSGTAYTALWTLMTLNKLDQDATFEYLTALNGNVAEYTASGSAPVQAVVNGAATTGVVFAHDCVAAIADGARDLVLSFPREGTGSEIGATALIKGSPDPAAARRWIDWALTAKAQEVGPRARAYQLPVNPKAKVSKFSIDLDKIKLVDYDFVKAGQQREALTDRFTTSVAPVPPEPEAAP
jgi:iron(III) transport system substrate-binding protein